MKKVVIKSTINFLFATSLILLAVTCSYAQTKVQEAKKMTMQREFEKLLVISGEEYQQNETQFRQGGAAAVAELNTRLNDSDTFTRLYAKTLLNWIQGHSPNNDAAIQYFETLPAALERTPIPSPSPLGAASYLSMHYQSTVIDLMSIHLIKRPDFPYWRTAAILFYLEEQKRPEVIDLLLRFVSETSNNELKDFALNAIDASQDPQLDTKILAEEARLKSKKLKLPEELKARISRPLLN